jgi:hypothetical protein
MGELDEAWAAALSEAEQRARLAGRKDIADYLSLRNSNDLIRQAGLDWLIAGFTTLARARVFKSRKRMVIVFLSEPRRWSAISSHSQAVFGPCRSKQDGPGHHATVSCAAAASRAQTFVTWE